MGLSCLELVTHLLEDLGKHIRRDLLIISRVVAGRRGGQVLSGRVRRSLIGKLLEGLVDQ